MDWDGEPYLNENKWTKRTTDASKFARYMGLIDYDAIVDAKNPPPQIHRRYGRLKYNIDTDTDDKEIELPNIKYADGIYCKIDIDRWVRSEADKYKEIITADMGVFPDDLQPYHTELFIEKTDHDRILDPICAKYLTNYQAFKGEGSLKAVTLLMERIEHVNKPVLIFYISDFDGKGEHMPTAFARKIEFLVRSKGVDKDIKLKPIALLPWQVKEYKLPRRPIKDGDKSKKKFEKKHGKGAVELDALEGICPGEFKKIVENALKPYFDENIVSAAYEKIDEVNSEIYNRAITALTDKSLFEEIKYLNSLIDKHEDIEAPYQNSIDELYDELDRKREELKAPYLAKIQAIEDEMEAECKKLEAPYNTRINEIEEKKADAIESTEAEIDEKYQDILNALPDIDLSDIDEEFVKPESDVSPIEGDEWLYDSSLSYFDQLKRYKNVATIENGDAC